MQLFKMANINTAGAVALAGRSVFSEISEHSDWLPRRGRVQNMDRTGVHGPPRGPSPWTTPNFQLEIAPVNMNIYQRSGHEKHRLAFIALCP